MRTACGGQQSARLVWWSGRGRHALAGLWPARLIGSVVIGVATTGALRRRARTGDEPEAHDPAPTWPPPHTNMTLGCSAANDKRIVVQCEINTPAERMECVEDDSEVERLARDLHHLVPDELLDHLRRAGTSVSVQKCLMG